MRIGAGPMAGQTGILRRWKSGLRIVLSMELIQRSILVDIDASSVAPINGKCRKAM